MSIGFILEDEDNRPLWLLKQWSKEVELEAKFERRDFNKKVVENE
jgi:hypothetical protein